MRREGQPPFLRLPHLSTLQSSRPRPWSEKNVPESSAVRRSLASSPAEMPSSALEPPLEWRALHLHLPSQCLLTPGGIKWRRPWGVFVALCDAFATDNGSAAPRSKVHAEAGRAPSARSGQNAPPIPHH